MKFLFILVLWTILLNLDVAAATSTRASMRPSRTTRSDQEYGTQTELMGLLDAEVEDALNEQQSIDLDEEIAEKGRVFQLQASKVQRAEFHRRHETVQKTNKKMAAKQRFDSHQTRGFSGGEHVGDKMYAISVTNQEPADNDTGESGGAVLVKELDQPVARQIKSSKAKSSLTSEQLVDRSNLEADNVILQPAVELLESNEVLDTNADDAGQTKRKKQLRRKKSRPQQLENAGQADVGSGASDPSKSDTHYHAAANNDAILNRSAELGAGHKNDALYDKAKLADAKEVVLTEERDEDKKLIPDYNLGEPIYDWNRKRQKWAREHPEVKQEQLFILTGTQPRPCHNAEGDHLLLRCFKNKVDYSRIHSVGLFYNTALLDAHMPTFWAKLPVVRATMLAHPEVEWIWWLDADAIVTDMEFSIPLHRYSGYNLVVHGWESLIFEKRSWLGLNAGSFLLRNCQWSLELLERWASMGPKAPMGDAYRHILSDFLPDRPRNPTDDQAALVFLLIKERQRWAGKLRVELDFFLSGYWLELMDGFEATEERYRAMEEQHAELWELLERQGAVGKEKLVAVVGRAREQHLSASGTTVQQRRPFITHFTGCQPCSGHHNTIYTAEQCRSGLLRALNYADDQVLRTLGYQHRALHLPDVLPSTSRAAAY